MNRFQTLLSCNLRPYIQEMELDEALLVSNLVTAAQMEGENPDDKESAADMRRVRATAVEVGPHTPLPVQRNLTKSNSSLVYLHTLATSPSVACHAAPFSAQHELL